MQGRGPSRVAESGEGRIRTGDTTIFSRVLYQLSYLGENPFSPLLLRNSGYLGEENTVMLAGGIPGDAPGFGGR